MTINIDETIKATFFSRWMSVAQFKKCIERLEDTDVLYPNRVGNLAVFRRNPEQKMVGYIDFNSELFEEASH